MMGFMDFLDLVKEMRDQQKKYFRDRSNHSLSLSKELERRVDREIESLRDTQKELPF